MNLEWTTIGNKSIGPEVIYLPVLNERNYSFDSIDSNT